MLPYSFKMGAIYIDSIPCLNIINYSHWLKKPNYNCPGELIIFLIYYFSNVKINKISFSTKKGTPIMISIKELRKKTKAYKKHPRQTCVHFPYWVITRWYGFGQDMIKSVFDEYIPNQ